MFLFFFDYPIFLGGCHFQSSRAHRVFGVEDAARPLARSGADSSRAVGLLGRLRRLGRHFAARAAQPESAPDRIPAPRSPRDFPKPSKPSKPPKHPKLSRAFRGPQIGVKNASHPDE